MQAVMPLRRFGLSRFGFFVAGLVAIVSACAQSSPQPGGAAHAALAAAPTALVAITRTAASEVAPAMPAFDVNGEVARFEAAFKHEVPNRIVDKPETERAWIARAQAMVAASDLSLSIDRPQLLVVVDRNPTVQQLRLVLARPEGNWLSLGGSKVSTGQTGRFDYYVTPTGVFLHTDLILDWRAEGTYNEHHVRGLGVKGMRVWDFGWQTAAKGWGTAETGEIRLLLHATDPDYLQRRLGRRASKGCVRISAEMNRFLDRHGVLDADYQRAAKDDPRFAALLLPDRRPTPLAGDAIVIIDSSQPLPSVQQVSSATFPTEPDASPQ
jgi:lipoprotein-anchoring transpeptidase ErfK/SrfK